MAGSTGFLENWERDIDVLERAREALSGAFQESEQTALLDDYIAQEQEIIQERLDSAEAGHPVAFEIDADNTLAVQVEVVIPAGPQGNSLSWTATTDH